MNKVLLLLSFVFVFSCSHHVQKTNNPKLYVFDCGEIIVSDISVFSPGVDKGVEKRLTNSCYLIKHAKGNFLWDTGLSDNLIKIKKGIKKNGIFHMKVKKTLVSQLKEIGISPEDIKYLSLSHLHSDHTGNMNLFKNAEVYLQKEEYKAAFSENPSKYGFDSNSYNQLKASQFMPIQGKFDVFGDGTAIIIPAKGHTPGHQILLVNLKDNGPIFLSGDLYHFTKNKINKRVPSFNFNKEQTLKSMREINYLIRTMRGKLWIQHDYEQNLTIKHSPEFYE